MQSKLLRHSIFLLSCFFINTVVFAQLFGDVGVSGTLHMYGGNGGIANHPFRINNGPNDDGGRFRVDEIGRVCIGIPYADRNNPLYSNKKFIVGGKTYFTSTLEFSPGLSYDQLVLYNDGLFRSIIKGDIYGISYVIGDFAQYHRFVNRTSAGKETELMRIESDGSVGIGTNDPGAYKLAVEGTVGARAVQVKATSWADFVFDKNYKLPPLKEVEAFVTTHKHLPGVPSGEEVKKEGINVANMDAILLQKIEELTLYAIEQNKRMEKQNKRMEAIEKENASLKEKLNKQ